MSLAEVIYNALTGQDGAARPSFDIVIRDMVHERAARGVSRRSLAKQTGIPESTLRRWEKGARPASRNAETRYGQLLAAHRHLVAVPAMLDRWRNHNMIFQLSDVKGQHGRSGRTVTADKMGLTPGTGDRIVEAFLRGDDQGAAHALQAGVTDHFYWQVFNDWLADENSDYVMGVTAA